MKRSVRLAILVVACAASASASELPQDPIAVRATTEDDTPLLEALTRALPAEGARLPLIAVATTSKPPKWVPSALLTRGAVPYTGVPGSLRAERPCHVSILLGERVIQSRSLGEGDRDAVFVIPLEQITGFLTTVRLRVIEDGSEKPVRRSMVLLRIPWNPQLLGVKNGSCFKESLAPTAGCLVISGGPFATHVVPIEHGLCRGNVVRLASAAAIAGRVRIPGRKRVKCKVTFVPQDAAFAPPPLQDWRCLTTSIDGTFRMNSGVRGPQTLIAEAEGCGLAAIAVDNTDGPLEEVEIVVPQRSVPVQIVTERRGLASPRFEIRTRDRLPLFADIATRSTPRTLRLAAGEYSLAVRAVSDDREVKIPFTVEPGNAPKTVEIPMHLGE